MTAMSDRRTPLWCRHGSGGLRRQLDRRHRVRRARRGARLLAPVVRRQPDAVVGLLRHDGAGRDAHRADQDRHRRRRRRHPLVGRHRGGPRHDQPAGAGAGVLRHRHRQHGEPGDGRQADADRRVRALHRRAAAPARRRRGRRGVPRRRPARCATSCRTPGSSASRRACRCTCPGSGRGRWPSPCATATAWSRRCRRTPTGSSGCGPGSRPPPTTPAPASTERRSSPPR